MYLLKRIIFSAVLFAIFMSSMADCYAHETCLAVTSPFNPIAKEDAWRIKDIGMLRHVFLYEVKSAGGIERFLAKRDDFESRVPGSDNKFVQKKVTFLRNSEEYIAEESTLSREKKYLIPCRIEDIPVEDGSFVNSKRIINGSRIYFIYVEKKSESEKFTIYTELEKEKILEEKGNFNTDQRSEESEIGLFEKHEGQDESLKVLPKGVTRIVLSVNHESIRRISGFFRELEAKELAQDILDFAKEGRVFCLDDPNGILKEPVDHVSNVAIHIKARWTSEEFEQVLIDKFMEKCGISYRVRWKKYIISQRRKVYRAYLEAVLSEDKSTMSCYKRYVGKIFVTAVNQALRDERVKKKFKDFSFVDLDMVRNRIDPVYKTFSSNVGEKSIRDDIRAAVQKHGITILKPGVIKNIQKRIKNGKQTTDKEKNLVRTYSQILKKRKDGSYICFDGKWQIAVKDTNYEYDAIKTAKGERHKPIWGRPDEIIEKIKNAIDRAVKEYGVEVLRPFIIQELRYSGNNILTQTEKDLLRAYSYVVNSKYGGRVMLFRGKWDNAVKEQGYPYEVVFSGAREKRKKLTSIKSKLRTVREEGVVRYIFGLDMPQLTQLIEKVPSLQKNSYFEDRYTIKEGIFNALTDMFMIEMEKEGLNLKVPDNKRLVHIISGELIAGDENERENISKSIHQCSLLNEEIVITNKHENVSDIIKSYAKESNKIVSAAVMDTKVLENLPSNVKALVFEGKTRFLHGVVAALRLLHSQGEEELIEARKQMVRLYKMLTAEAQPVPIMPISALDFENPVKLSKILSFKLPEPIELRNNQEDKPEKKSNIAKTKDTLRETCQWSEKSIVRAIQDAVRKFGDDILVNSVAKEILSSEMFQNQPLALKDKKILNKMERTFVVILQSKENYFESDKKKAIQAAGYDLEAIQKKIKEHKKSLTNYEKDKRAKKAIHDTVKIYGLGALISSEIYHMSWHGRDNLTKLEKDIAFACHCAERKNKGWSDLVTKEVCDYEKIVQDNKNRRRMIAMLREKFDKIKMHCFENFLRGLDKLQIDELMERAPGLKEDVTYCKEHKEELKTKMFNIISDMFEIELIKAKMAINEASIEGKTLIHILPHELIPGTYEENEQFIKSINRIFLKDSNKKEKIIVTEKNENLEEKIKEYANDNRYVVDAAVTDEKILENLPITVKALVFKGQTRFLHGVVAALRLLHSQGEEELIEARKELVRLYKMLTGESLSAPIVPISALDFECPIKLAKMIIFKLPLPEEFNYEDRRALDECVIRILTQA